MDNSLHQIELQILQLLGIAVSSGVLWLLQRAVAWFNLKLTAERQARLASAVDKMMTLGVTKADDIIRERGWDHIDSKNAVINYALPALETRFSDTLTSAGIDLSDQKSRIGLINMMERMWPDVATRLSASPVTAPAPVVPVAVVATPGVAA